jgi:tRNA threonylcarbamoyladenosine biosynthesis protein TsaE
MAEPTANLTLTLHLPNEAATTALGAALARALLGLEDQIRHQGFTVHLQGELGAGKTTLVRGLLRQLGVTGSVKSPSYTLLELYEVSRLHLYHFDFYRFKSPREFSDAGFSEYFGPGAICLAEWPAKAGEFLPDADLHVTLQVLEAGRSATIGANTEIGRACQDRLETFLREARAGA